MSEGNCVSGGIRKEPAKLCAKQGARAPKLLISNNSSDVLKQRCDQWCKCKLIGPLGIDYTTIILASPLRRNNRSDSRQSIDSRQ